MPLCRVGGTKTVQKLCELWELSWRELGNASTRKEHSPKHGCDATKNFACPRMLNAELQVV